MSVNIPDTPHYKTWHEEGDSNWTIEKNWTWHDAFVWNLLIGEKFNFADKIKEKQMEHHIHDAFTLKDKHALEATLSKSESFSIKDVPQRYLSFVRKFEENFGCSEFRYKELTKAFNASLKFSDSILKSAKGVISDICFERGAWTIENVDIAIHKGKHVGYENFKPFIYGDYYYQKALFRTVIDSEGKDRGVIEQSQISIDVPDLVDRGSAEVIDKNYNLTVEFNKKFHTAPEVTITMKSGSSATPVVANIVEITEKHFVMFLQNAITGDKVVGRFIWMATGY